MTQEGQLWETPKPSVGADEGKGHPHPHSRRVTETGATQAESGRRDITVAYMQDVPEVPLSNRGNPPGSILQGRSRPHTLLCKRTCLGGWCCCPAPTGHSLRQSSDLRSGPHLWSMGLTGSGPLTSQGSCVVPQRRSPVASAAEQAAGGPSVPRVLCQEGGRPSDAGAGRERAGTCQTYRYSH